MQKKFNFLRGFNYQAGSMLGGIFLGGSGVVLDSTTSAALVFYFFLKKIYLLSQ